MSKYIDLVLCRHDNDTRKYLFLAPKYSFLKEGERVIVRTQKGEQFATVVDTITVLKDSDEYEFIIGSCNGYEPLAKVVGRIKYEELRFEEE